MGWRHTARWRLQNRPQARAEKAKEKGYFGPPTLTLDATNAKCYADRYPDLKAAFGYNTNALIDHWNRHGKTEGRYFNCGGQLSKTVDTSACNFKNDNVVYITSVGGVTDHWR